MAELWRRFSEAVNHPAAWFPWTSLTDYEDWKAQLDRGVGSFWTCQGERLALLATYRNQDPRGIVRVLKGPIHPWDRQTWGEGEFRGEIQDLLWPGEDQGLRQLVEAAVEVLKARGLNTIGASAWREDQCQALLGSGFQPVARSVLLGWRVSESPTKSNDEVRIEYLQAGQESLVQGIFSANWGIPVTVIPYMEFQQPLLAWVHDEPVGAALLNKYSGNLDLGIQVLEPSRRMYVGVELVRAAIEACRQRGFSQMYVVRNLPPSGMRESDEVAFRFYEDTGARLLREYSGYRWKP